jgi:hypothetical protein
MYSRALKPLESWLQHTAQETSVPQKPNATNANSVFTPETPSLVMVQ